MVATQIVDDRLYVGDMHGLIDDRIGAASVSGRPDPLQGIS